MLAKFKTAIMYEENTKKGDKNVAETNLQHIELLFEI